MSEWEEIEALTKDQLYTEAVERLGALGERAEKDGDHDLWTRALIREVQLRTALGGFATASERLRDRPWPQGEANRTLLHLFYAEGLYQYIRAYSWEIRRRERIDSGGEIDLEKATLDDLVAEASRSLMAIWSERQSWASRPLGPLAEFVSKGDYPERIRGTLRDTVTYLWVELLADTSLWKPAQSNRLYQLNLDALLEPAGGAGAAVDPGDLDEAPIARLVALLDDLELWHLQEGRVEAASEARLSRIRRLRSAFPDANDRGRFESAVRDHLDDLGSDVEWWAVGQALLAEIVQQENRPDSLVRARELALAGQRLYPETIGGERCAYLVESIELTNLTLTSMTSDGPGNRSIKVEHTNLAEVHLRAYRIDLDARLRRTSARDLLIERSEIERLIATGKPAASWSVELPPTPDFRSHDTYVTPPLTEPGAYAVVASTGLDFDDPEGQRQAVTLVVTDLVLLRRSGGRSIELTVRSGRTGRAVSGVELSLWKRDYRRGHQRVVQHFSNAEGKVQFRLPDRRGSYFVVAKKDDQIALDDSAVTLAGTHSSWEGVSALVYTDRSVYRPGQEVLWKVVAYAGSAGAGRFETEPDRAVAVKLTDAAGENVAEFDGRTNEFGSLSGSFTIPAGLRLGQWAVRTDRGASAWIQVEEYKRPTFEAVLEHSDETLRLNRPARLAGSAEYYFGLPVAGASVSWRVDREPVYPRRFHWWRPDPGRAETIGGGVGETDEEGRFELEFVPEADEELAETGVTYRYSVTAEITDEGGETRSARRSFRLGFVAVEAAIEVEKGFLDTGRPIDVAISRADLDGRPAPGSGEWRLLRVEEPEAARLPSEQPVPASDSGHYATAGDQLRPRWEAASPLEALIADWPDGETVSSGTVKHGADGAAVLELPGLEAGVYRLRYSTRDSFDGRFETRSEWVVVKAGESSLAAPAVLAVELKSVEVGSIARLLVHSGIADQEMVFEVFQSGRRLAHQTVQSEDGPKVIEIPVGPEHRGGFGVRLTALRDHQLMSFSETIFVPWSDRELKVEFESFRDLLRPGTKERWSIRLEGPDGGAVEEGAGELLAYMYDRSLDLFGEHTPSDPLALYPHLAGGWAVHSTISGRGAFWRSRFPSGRRHYRSLQESSLKFFDGYPVGGPGRRYRNENSMEMRPMAMKAASVDAVAEDNSGVVSEPLPTTDAQELREDFAETAFWKPHLRTAADGTVAFDFEVPDSLTEWNVWVHALTRDLKAGRTTRKVRTAKDLMVRPYLPRFLREGDRAELQVAVNNAGESPFEGVVELEILDPETGRDLRSEFGLSGDDLLAKPFAVAPGGGTTVRYALQAPTRVGGVAFKVLAQAGSLRDGELRPLPILPGRMHLAQSRFVALRDADRREMVFPQMRRTDDPTRVDEQLVVTLDAQLFAGVLSALPYLIDYPYECTEQTLNRFLSTGIVHSVFEQYPSVARLAADLAARETQLEPWEGADANRKMTLEETPWVHAAGGGKGDDLTNLLDPQRAAREQRVSLAKLERAQLPSGAFPWWPGGPPSPYMTLYLAYGFSKALEFGVEVPKPLVRRAWGYLQQELADELQDLAENRAGPELVTFLNYALSNYPDDSWTGGVFSAEQREDMLAYSFLEWRRHSPLLKGYLALTLARAGRLDDAEKVWESIMDSAKTTQDEGTFWAPEERSWLWYNDTIETHAFALRVLQELDSTDDRRHGLVQWLFLNKKLNQWKSTRSTAEVIYSLVHYLKAEGQLGLREQATVLLGDRRKEFVFEPDAYTGRNNQLVVSGAEIDARTMATVVVEKETPGMLFASSTWHFSTEELPKEASGDLFSVTRQAFLRVDQGGEKVLRPLAEGAALSVGDQLEVQLTVKARHAAEYVHLRDPRPAGFEPESLTSGYRWDLGLGWFEEIRDSGTNFFFDWLPAGEYVLKYRLRASTAGTFKAAPATLQSMYAPEFTAYSAGRSIEIKR